MKHAYSDLYVLAPKSNMAQDLEDIKHAVESDDEEDSDDDESVSVASTRSTVVSDHTTETQLPKEESSNNNNNGSGKAKLSRSSSFPNFPRFDGDDDDEDDDEDDDDDDSDDDYDDDESENKKAFRHKRKVALKKKKSSEDDESENKGASRKRKEARKKKKSAKAKSRKRSIDNDDSDEDYDDDESENKGASRKRKEAPKKKKSAKSTSRKRSIDSRPERIGQLKDEVMRDQHDKMLHRMNLVQNLCTFPNETERDRYPKVMPIIVTFDELVEKPHKVKTGMLWRDECFASVLVPEGLSSEMVGEMFIKLGNEMIENSGKDFLCTNNVEEYKKGLFGQSERKGEGDDE